MIHQVVSRTKDGLRLQVKAKPATSKDRGLQLVDVGDGQCAVEIGVKEIAQDGRANKALIKKIAEAFGVKASCVVLRIGPKSRLKLFDILGDPEALFKQAQKLLQAS